MRREEKRRGEKKSDETTNIIPLFHFLQRSAPLRQRVRQDKNRQACHAIVREREMGDERGNKRREGEKRGDIR